MTYCGCVEWNKYISFLDGMVAMAYSHDIKLPDDYPAWKYCPWCGKELLVADEHMENL